MVETEACPNNRLTVLGHINQLNRSVSHRTETCSMEQRRISAGAFRPISGGMHVPRVSMVYNKNTANYENKLQNSNHFTLLTCWFLLTSVFNVRSVSVGRRGIAGAYRQGAIKSSLASVVVL